jgi:hypothetical protein
LVLVFAVVVGSKFFQKFVRGGRSFRMIFGVVVVVVVVVESSSSSDSLIRRGDIKYNVNNILC